MKLKQVCNHPVSVPEGQLSRGRPKRELARLREMIEETLEEGDRSLVFTQFAEMGTLLQRHLQETFASKSCSCTAESPRSAGTR